MVRTRVIRVLPIAVAGVLASYGAGAGLAAGGRSASTLTATAVRLGDHPAYVRAVVDFRGGRLQLGEVDATDPSPVDGKASVEVIRTGVRSAAAPRSAFGLTVRIVQGRGRLKIVLRSAPRRFKYLSYAIVTGDRLAIDLWKSAPPSRAAAIRRCASGQLTLDSVSVDSLGVVRASGRARDLFENQFASLVRAADGRVLAQRRVHAAAGRWHASLFVSSPRRRTATFEGAVASPKDGALSCLVQVQITLPFTGPAPLHLVYRAHSDVDGDGRPDLITLRKAGTHRAGLIRVTLASGRLLSIRTSTFAVMLPALASVGNVDGRAGSELFVDVEHISTNEFIGVYTYWHGQLRRVGTLAGYSAHPGLWAGMTCGARGARHLITVHQFVEFSGYWTRQDTDYVWRGPSLELYAKHPEQRISGMPPSSLVGLHCGHAPAP